MLQASMCVWVCQHAYRLHTNMLLNQNKVAHPFFAGLLTMRAAFWLFVLLAVWLLECFRSRKIRNSLSVFSPSYKMARINTTIIAAISSGGKKKKERRGKKRPRKKREVSLPKRKARGVLLNNSKSFWLGTNVLRQQALTWVNTALSPGHLWKSVYNITINSTFPNDWLMMIYQLHNKRSPLIISCLLNLQASICRLGFGWPGTLICILWGVMTILVSKSQVWALEMLAYLVVQ